jgi:GNAT superfamily N-acetyltransferase
MQKQDLEPCARLLVKSYNQPPWRYQWDEQKALVYLQEYFEVKQFVGFVLHDAGELAAAMFAHTKTWWTTNQLYIDELFVTPDRQRTGYGKSLLDEALRFGQEHGFPTVFLMTNKFMPAHKFYLKNEFAGAEHFIFMFRQT